PDTVGLRTGIGDEIARCKAQFVHAPIDLFGEIADVLQPPELAKGRVDMADRDHARHAGCGGDGQKEQEAAKGHLSDRWRERSDFLQDRRETCWHGFEPGASKTDYIQRRPRRGEHVENTRIAGKPPCPTRSSWWRFSAPLWRRSIAPPVSFGGET